MATTRAKMTGSAPDQSNPWAWNQWAQTQDPNLYGWKNHQEATAADLPALKPILQQQGKWTPQLEAAMNAYKPAQEGTTSEAGTTGAAAAEGDVPLSSLGLTGYQRADARSSGYNHLQAILGPDGAPVAGNVASMRDSGSWKSGDWKSAASVVGGVLLAGYGAQALAGAGAGTATTTAGTVGATTAETAPVWNAALAESAAGTGGYGASSAGLGGGATASWGAGAGYTADAVAGGSTAAPTSTGGYWNGTDFSGTAPQAGSSNLGNAAATGAKGMSTADWLNAGLTAYSIANQPDAPDTSGINAAAASSAQLSKDAFDWFKGEYTRTQGQRDEAAARDGKIADAQLEGMNFATQQAKDLAERNKTVFQPVEDRIVHDATTFDTPERRAQAVAEATADVESAAGRAQQANSRAMMRAGVNLDSPAAAALAQDASLAKAKMIAGSTGAATRNVEQQGWARLNDAAALGKGVVGNQATQQQIATNSGAASVNAGAGAINANQAGTGIMQTGFNTSMQGAQNAGSLFGQAGQLVSTTRGQDLNFLGNAFNSYMRSSKKVKKNTGDTTDGTKELAEVMATPVQQDWQYDPAKGGPDDGGQPHTGPMAETVRAKMGDEVAPGGEVIDMKAMGGKLMAAIQAVTRDVAELRDQMATRARMGKQPATKEA